MKLHEKTVKKLEDAFAIGASIPEACYFANITKQTYYNWIKDNEELKEKFDRLREKPILKARQTVVDNLNKPEYAFRYLEKKRKDEFGNETKIINEGEITHTHKKDIESNKEILKLKEEFELKLKKELEK